MLQQIFYLLHAYLAKDSCDKQERAPVMHRPNASSSSRHDPGYFQKLLQSYSCSLEVSAGYFFES